MRPPGIWPRRCSVALGSLTLALLVALAGCSSHAGVPTSATPATGPTTTAVATSTSQLPAPTSVPHPTPGHPCGVDATPPNYSHVVVILMENTSYGALVGSRGAPFITSIARQCGVAANYHNITHESLPNYIGMTDGESPAALAPFDDDCSPGPQCEVTTPGIFTQVKSWKAYDESMPNACNRSGTSLYAVRHNPAAYYTDLGDCAQRDVPLGGVQHSSLLSDFADPAEAPAYAFVTPNICDDMHGAPYCPTQLITAGDSWLRTWVTLLTATATYRQAHTVLFITWDEGGGGYEGESCATNLTDQSCHVPLIVVAPSVPSHTVDGQLLNHYSLLRAAEQLLGVPELGEARSAPSLVAGFRLGRGRS